MPAQKRSFETQQRDDDSLQEDNTDNHEEQHQQQLDGDFGEDSDRSLSSSNEEEKQEFILVKLSEIRREVQCPICLDDTSTEKGTKIKQTISGIIRKTRTVMECLHRFCRECIDKSMRLGNNECPACRTHCASRRSLRDDPKYDALIAALYPDIDKYEEEELAFHEEEKARNKQIQASIAQTFRRQAEALTRKRSSAKAISRRTGRHSRGRRNFRASELQLSDDNEDGHGDEGKDSSSADEQSAEVRPKRFKRWTGTRSAGASADGGGDDESMGASVGLVGPSERWAWGKGGIRSHTRYGGANAGNGKNVRNSRTSKFTDYLRNLDENSSELDIHLMLVSSDEQRTPSLQRPYLCCKSTLSVKQLCQYVALQTTLPAEEVEIYLVKESSFRLNPPNSMSKPSLYDLCRDKLQILKEEDTLAGLKKFNLTSGHVVLAYQKKVWKPEW